MFEVFNVFGNSVGIFKSVEDFVRNYYYTKETHEDWLAEMAEEEGFDPNNSPYENEFSFWVNTIKDEMMAVDDWDAKDVEGIEWGGYTFFLKGE